MPSNRHPLLSPVQLKASEGKFPPVPANCVVTGATGFVGARLVEMLVERGAKRVVAFDIVPKDKTKYAVWDHPAIEYVTGDVTDAAACERAVQGADCCWHIAAAVGPFHPRPLYIKVNYQGTINMLEACKKAGVTKFVMSSSPSTRFVGSLINRPCYDGPTEADMPKLPLKSYMQTYAETKAMGEMEVTKANSDTFFTVSVAPHQVYGPRDVLFFPNVMEAAITGKLRIFGDGKNRICFTHVDNYCHGLIIAERKLFKASPVLGKFYIVTDGNTHPHPEGYSIFWDEVADAVEGLGLKSLRTKMHLPFWFLYTIALCANFVGWLMNTTFKLNVFNVFVLTMHRWFDISAAQNELDYQPIVGFREGWADTIAWFKQHWLQDAIRASKSSSVAGLNAHSQTKIDIQAKKNH